VQRCAFLLKKAQRAAGECEIAEENRRKKSSAGGFLDFARCAWWT
jgi:hypothetical protein